MMENPEKQGVGRGPRGEGKGHTLGREGGRRRNRRHSSPASPEAWPRSTPAGPGGRETQRPLPPLLLASSESRSLNYG